TANPIYSSRIPFDDQRIHAAAIYCSDGRFGEQMDEFVQQHLGLPRYDRLAIPGGAACLAGHLSTHHERAALEKQLRFLVDVHKLDHLILIAHQDCAFYRDIWLAGRTLAQQQEFDLKVAADFMRGWSSALQVETYFAKKVEGRIVFEE